MRRVMEQFKTFFESYEVTNALMDIDNIKVHIFEAKSKSLLNVRLVEIQNRQILGSKRLEKNTFADINVENNQVKMVFRVVKVTNELKESIKRVSKNDHMVKYVGNHVTITITNPRLEETSRVFLVIEPYCRKYKG